MADRGMSEAVWMTWKEFGKVIRGKEVVFFGVSEWARKTLRKVSIPSFYFVDNSPSWIGTRQLDAEVKDPRILKEKKPNRFVVIMSGSYESIFPQLLEYGLKPGEDFCISPILNNLKVITDIHGHEARILVSSPDHMIYSGLDKNKKSGGGLFTYDIKTLECRKVLEGTFHQIVEAEDHFYVADEVRGVCEVGKDFKLLGSFGAEEAAKPHGVAYCPERKLVFMAVTGKDKINVYDAQTKKLKSEILFTKKFERTGEPGHWINDLFVNGDYLYASMFSHTGAYLQGSYDGGIVEIHMDDTSERHILTRNNWMPHSVIFFDSEMCFADSMNGYLYKTDKNVIGEFFGFIRGIAFDGSYYYVGQSETRYFDRLKGIRKNIGMSAGFYLFDEETKAAKFFSMPQVHQVRDLHVLKGGD